MKEITIYELIKLVKEGKAPNKVIYNDKVWYKKGQDYCYENYADTYLFLSVCKNNKWLDIKITAFDEPENKSNENKKDKKDILKELKDLNSDWGFGSCDMHIEELRLDMQTVKKWINDIVKVVNNGNR